MSETDHATKYAICFDFPEAEGEPWFAAQLREGLGWTMSFAESIRFDSEDAAEQLLTNGFGAEVRKYGAVVEVGG